MEALFWKVINELVLYCQNNSQRFSLVLHSLSFVKHNHQLDHIDHIGIA